MAQYHACDSRNIYPGEIVLSEETRRIRSCQENIDVDYKESDVTNYMLLDIFRGRKLTQYGSNKRLNTDKDSRIIVTITSHGGENFIKVRGNMVILSDELNRALNEMYIKQRFKQILFILDTCEGYSLFDNVYVPNVFFVASALVNQKASSYSFDRIMMESTVDKFHFLLYNKIKKIQTPPFSYNKSVEQFFVEVKNEKKFLETDVQVKDLVNNTMLVQDFFGNNELGDSENLVVKMGNSMAKLGALSTLHSKEAKNLVKTKQKLDVEVMENMRKYTTCGYFISRNIDSLEFNNNIGLIMVLSMIVLNFIFSIIIK